MCFVPVVVPVLLRVLARVAVFVEPPVEVDWHPDAGTEQRVAASDLRVGLADQLYVGLRTTGRVVPALLLSESWMICGTSASQSGRALPPPREIRKPATATTMSARISAAPARGTLLLLLGRMAHTHSSSDGPVEKCRADVGPRRPVRRWSAPGVSPPECPGDAGRPGRIYSAVDPAFGESRVNHGRPYNGGSSAANLVPRSAFPKPTRYRRRPTLTGHPRPSRCRLVFRVCARAATRHSDRNDATRRRCTAGAEFPKEEC